MQTQASQNNSSHNDIPDELPQPGEGAPKRIIAYNAAANYFEESYKPNLWVTPKLSQLRASSSLLETITGDPASIKVAENNLSIDLKLGNGKTTTLEISFFQERIIKLKCLNIENPSKFSLEMIDKPIDLPKYLIKEKLSVRDDDLEVILDNDGDDNNVQAKLYIRFNPFEIKLIYDKNPNNREVVLEIGTQRSIKFDTNISVDFSFDSENLYGIPQRAHHLLLEDTTKGLPYRIFNLDIGGYPPFSKVGLYGSVPIIMAKRKTSPNFVAVYWQNASDTYVDIHKKENSSKTFWMSERGNLECYIFASKSPDSHFKKLSQLTGYCAMPQYFSLGYHHSRYCFKDQNDILEVNRMFNKLEIPCDTLTLDIDHTHERHYFSWHKRDFPDPKGLQEVLERDERKLIVIQNPHLKVDEDYRLYNQAMEKRLYILNKDREPFVGTCHPGKSIYLDFLNEETREFWAEQYRYENYQHSSPILFAWNDMNEPTVFLVEDLIMDADNLHTIKTLKEESEIAAFQVEHREVHNLYGYCMNKATYKGLLERNKDQNIRPHALTRSFFAGSQKWTTVWTGDTLSSWKHLKITVPMMLSLSLFGISFCGGDVGGFIGDPEPELLLRWYQLGTFMPYFRAHSYIDFKRREPWLFSKEILQLIKGAIEERYRMLPYWYTMFEEHCRSGVPVLRPLWLDTEILKDEEELYREEERFMVGDALLVVPVYEKGKEFVEEPLKGLQGRWYDYYLRKEVANDEKRVKTGLERIGCFVKGGSIVPLFELKKYAKSSKAARESDLVLLVVLDEEEKARGKMYFDDGETFDYRKGRFAKKRIEFKENILKWEKEGDEEYLVENKITQAVIMGNKKVYKEASLLIEGEKVKIQLFVKEGNLHLHFEATVNKNWEIILS